MNPTTVPQEMAWPLALAIVGGFLVVFPLFWCGVVWLLSRMGGWHHLATRYAAGNRPVAGACHGGVTGMVGGVSYRGVLTVHFVPEGFFLEVMVLFRIGHPRLFIPWAAVSGRQARRVLWWNAVSLSVGQPVISTVTLPAKLLEGHLPG